VILANVKLPIFSIKSPEAFQVMSALPIPQPSSLIGMLAYCLGVVTGEGTKALKRVVDWVQNGKVLAARSALLGSLPLSLSSTVLRRFRIVDKAHEKKTKLPKPIDRISEALIKQDLSSVKKIFEIELTDAFYREYVMGHELLCAWVLSDDVDIEAKWLMLANRIGDTESLCTVTKVDEAEGDVYEDTNVKTKFPIVFENVTSFKSKFHVTLKMCDEARNLRIFIIPCELKMKEINGKVASLIFPSEIEAKYNTPIKLVRVEKYDIVIPSVMLTSRIGWWSS